MNSLTVSDEKLIRSLKQKKYRKIHQLFVVEGEKLVHEALESNFQIKWIISTKQNIDKIKSDSTLLCEEPRMKKISSLTSPPGIMAVIEIPNSHKIQEVEDLQLVLENIQDPGNLGTIIRTADAFGIQSIICSEETVDFYSPKVVQASMGSIFRVNLFTRNLFEFLEARKKDSKIYGSHLGGENLYSCDFIKPSILVMGSESHGISKALMELIHESVKIPIAGKAESFNVSIATAILLGEISRQFSLQ